MNKVIPLITKEVSGFPLIIDISLFLNVLIRIKKHRDFKGEIKSITVSKTVDDKYYISLLVEENINPTPIENIESMIGLDLGIKELIIDSNGHKYKRRNNPYIWFYYWNYIIFIYTGTSNRSCAIYHFDIAKIGLIIILITSNKNILKFLRK